MKITVMKKLTFALVLIVTLIPITSFAQTNFIGGMHFNAGFPTGDLKDNIDHTAYGFDAHIFYAPYSKPFGIGLEASYLNYGSDSRSEPFSPTVPEVTIDITTTYNIFQMMFVLRRQTSGPIQFYGDLLGGFNYLFTRTSITGSDSNDDISTNNFDDLAFSYGVGGGIMLPLYTRLETERFDRPLQILVDIGGRYIGGGEAEYLNEGSIVRDGSNVTYYAYKSRTDMFKLNIGVMVRF